MKDLSRRAFLGRSALIGCSAAASPLFTPVSFAAAPWDTRLVVIVLRGGMDGLDVVQPYGDPLLAGMRPTLKPGPANGAADLDGFFALHPSLAPLMPLWAAGELAFMQAVSTPYREKRSHFEGQDLLEAGTADAMAARDGWLNRMLQLMPGVEAQTAYAIGHGDMRILDGRAPVADWTPEAELSLSPQTQRLAESIMEEDPAFHAALSEALILSDGNLEIPPLDEAEEGGMMMGMADNGARPRRPGREEEIAGFAADMLRGPARVASFSINGWDTHYNQGRTLPQALERLARTILTLRARTGTQVWNKTAVVAVTEFGRTARENGTKGTDHGTGGTMLMAGGAIRGGRVYGDWPGLDEADLYNRRDLMPTRDIRAPIGWLMHGLTGLSRSEIEATVFPGLDMGSDPRILG